MPLTGHKFLPEEEAGRDFQRELTDWLGSNYGLDPDILGLTALDEALQVRSRDTGMSDFGVYVEHWRQDERERAALLQRLLVGETWLFREWASFQCLEDWLRRHGASFSPGEPLRILSLPCATGEEAWSIAALVDEAGLDAARASIDAMDINPDALKLAREGSYAQRKLRGQPPERWSRAFQLQSDGRLRVTEALRGLVRFVEGNAMDSAAFGKRGSYHIIFCRNMLIYMNTAARHQICQTLHRYLRPEGLLFLGHAEVAAPGLGLVRSGIHGAFAWRREREGEAATAQIPPALPSRTLENSRPAAARLPLPRTVSRSLLPRPPEAVSSGANTPHARESAIPGGQSERAAQTGSRNAFDLDAVRRLANAGRYEAALGELESPAADASLDPEVHALAGIILGAVGRKTQAIARLRQALFLEPNHAESLAHLALLLEEQGDTAGAARLRGRLPGSVRP